MNLGQQIDPLLPRPPDDADEYTREFHRRVSEMLVALASRTDNHIPYSVDTTKVLVPDPTAQNGITWGTVSAGAGVSLPFIFGSGRDGAADLDGVNTYSWAVLSGSTYSLSRNPHLTNLTIQSGINLNLHQFLLYVNGTLTGIDATSVIRNKGLDGGNGTSGSVGAGGSDDGSGGSWSASHAGGGGSASGGNGGDATASDHGMGGVGGVGGTTNAGIGGQGPSAWAIMPESNTGGVNYGFCLNTIPLQLRWMSNNANGTCNGGGGGGGGGSGGANANSGGGGGPGGCSAIFTALVAGAGTVNLSGGNGGNAFSSGGLQSGGGGGGGGGYLAWWHKLTLASWTTTVAGGTGGTGLNGGANGVAGTAGNFAEFIII